MNDTVCDNLFIRKFSVNALPPKGALMDSSPSVGLKQPILSVMDIQNLPLVLIKELEHENLIVVSHAARTIELLGNKAKNAIPAMKACLKRAYSVRF